MMLKFLGILALVAVFEELSPAPTGTFLLAANDERDVKQLCHLLTRRQYSIHCGD